MDHLESLTMEDLSIIKESLNYTKLKFEDYQGYPSYEFKQKRVTEITNILNKVFGIIRVKSKEASNK